MEEPKLKTTAGERAEWKRLLDRRLNQKPMLLADDEAHLIADVNTLLALLSTARQEALKAALTDVSQAARNIRTKAIPLIEARIAALDSGAPSRP